MATNKSEYNKEFLAVDFYDRIMKFISQCERDCLHIESIIKKFIKGPFRITIARQSLPSSQMGSVNDRVTDRTRICYVKIRY